ncbi:hypothetical protein UFOVP312_42 [uncultured Caudovirales phage]|uniref:Uncharacterized protein n=1 Tax=uncultured Caudovirales phage TaxID=2100421 RepID=A0A6J5LUG6_9CAUD|nr:hypothetical protein UFOVP312_42 [uncultured Caudovirales phage]
MPLLPLQPLRVSRRASAAQTAQVSVIPAPTGGLNYRDPISAMSPMDALILTNLIPKQQGVELRKGWQQTTSSLGEPIESVFGYTAPNSENNKVFVAADGNIYDVTDGTYTVAVPATGSDADEWWTTQFSTPADTFLLAVSPGAGYWTYSTSSGWVDRTATTTGLPTTVRTVAVWKQRVWFTAEGDSNVYYLDSVDVVTGACTSFAMGSTLRNGGYVSALINWTMDAGFSIDDFLIVVGTEGDIGVWQGTDPTSADTFSLKGVWYVGPVPRHGQYFTPFGGDVMIVSELGLVPMSKLVAGQYTQDQQIGPASKIQSVFAPLVRKQLNQKFFDVFVVPSSDVLVIKMPADAGTYRQFAMNVTTGAWCQFVGMPMRSAAVIGGQCWFGTQDGYTCLGLYGNKDGVDEVGAGGNSIEGEVQTAFQSFNTPAQLKKFGMARPIFIATAQPAVKLVINTQFVFSTVGGSPYFFEDNNGIWDASVWNGANWVGQNTYQAWFGTTGLGYYGSLRMKVRGLPATVFTSAHMMTELGGVM